MVKFCANPQQVAAAFLNNPERFLNQLLTKTCMIAFLDTSNISIDTRAFPQMPATLWRAFDDCNHIVGLHAKQLVCGKTPRRTTNVSGDKKTVC